MCDWYNVSNRVAVALASSLLKEFSKVNDNHDIIVIGQNLSQRKIQ